MHDTEMSTAPTAKRIPWNKGKLTGAKPPLRPKHVWAIRTMLQNARQVLDLALFNLAIDSKLRGCDVVAVKVDDVAPNGYAADRATVRQRKTGRPVRFELTEQTRHSIDDYIRLAGKKSGQFLTRVSMGRTRCAEPRQHSSTGVQAISGPSSCSLGIARSRAQCGIWASRWTTPSPLRSRLTSKGTWAEGKCSALMSAISVANSGLADQAPPIRDGRF
jgi:integrase